MAIVYKKPHPRYTYNDSYIELLNLKDFESLDKIKIERGDVRSANFSSDSKYFAYSCNNIVYIYNINNKTTKQIVFNKDNEPNKIEISPDCNFIAILAGELNIYDINKLTKLLTIDKNEFYKPFTALKYFHKGDRVAVGSEGEIDIFETRNGKFVAKFKSRKFLNSDFNKFIITDNDSLLICTESGENIYFYDVNNYKYIKEIRFNAAQDIDISPDNNTISIWNFDCGLYFYNIDLDKFVFELKGSYRNDGLHLLNFAPDFKYIYWTSFDTLKFYPLSNNLNRSKLYEKRFKDYISEVGLKYKGHSQRGEFESIDEYMARAKLFLTDIYNIKLKYMSEIYFIEQGILDQAIYSGNEINNRITSSIRDTLISIEMVGEYDIDNKLLPITINGNIKNILMDVDEAKKFKMNIKDVIVRAKCKLKTDLKTLEYYDIVIIHPYSKKEYLF
ncbi:MAG: WD40 repeat domain-containing protein [Ignavibacteria bacterium]|nr:WD40 repeat domain-containing protein [Ignavibacteria bacterium]